MVDKGFILLPVFFRHAAWQENIVVYLLEVSRLHRCSKKPRQLFYVCLFDVNTCWLHASGHVSIHDSPWPEFVYTFSLHYQPGCPVLFLQKATRKTDKVQPDELDVTVLTDQGLKDELLKHGVDAGPIVGECSRWHKNSCRITRLKTELTSALSTHYDCTSYTGMLCVGAPHRTQVMEFTSGYDMLSAVQIKQD